MFIGILLLLIGVLLILDKLGIFHISFGDYILPVALIALGLSFITEKRKNK